MRATILAALASMYLLVPAAPVEAQTIDVRMSIDPNPVVAGGEVTIRPQVIEGHKSRRPWDVIYWPVQNPGPVGGQPGPKQKNVPKNCPHIGHCTFTVPLDACESDFCRPVFGVISTYSTVAGSYRLYRHEACVQVVHPDDPSIVSDWDCGLSTAGGGGGGSGGGSGGGGGGGARQTVPDAPTNLLADGDNEQVALAWEAPEDDGGSKITDYEYRIDGEGEWISIGSTLTTHTVTSLVNGTECTFQVRAVSRIGRSQPSSDPSEATPRAAVTLLVANFSNGNDGAFNSRVYLWNPSTSAGQVTVRVFTLPLTFGIVAAPHSELPLVPVRVASEPSLQRAGYNAISVV